MSTIFGGYILRAKGPLDLKSFCQPRLTKTMCVYFTRRVCVCVCVCVCVHLSQSLVIYGVSECVLLTAAVVIESKRCYHILFSNNNLRDSPKAVQSVPIGEYKVCGILFI